MEDGSMTGSNIDPEAESNRPGLHTLRFSAPEGRRQPLNRHHSPFDPPKNIPQPSSTTLCESIPVLEANFTPRKK